MLDFLNKYWLELVGVATGIGALYTLYEIYEKRIVPKRRKAKLVRLLELIQDWYDFIFIHFDKEIDMDVLSLKEKKILEYINDNLPNAWLVFTKSDRMKFLKMCGVKENLQADEKLFEHFSRCPSDKILVRTLWHLTNDAFYIFKRNYPKNITPENALPNVEMRIKILKSYLDVKAK